MTSLEDLIASFDPRQRLAEVQAGQWPAYEKFFRHRLKDRSLAARQLAQGLSAFRTLITRDLIEEFPLDGTQAKSDAFLTRVIEVVQQDKQAETFLAGHILGLLRGKAGPLTAVRRANKRIKTGKLEQVIFVPKLVVLGVIHFREPAPECFIEEDELRKVVTPHTRHKNIEDSYWRRILARPEIRQLVPRPPTRF